MDMKIVDEAVEQIAQVLPERQIDLVRLKALAPIERPATVTVIGKYNHGKSRLLNELIGHDIFSVADRRETIALSEHTHQSEHLQQPVSWLDAPGLDADVIGEDDRLAQEALWCKSDIRLFVHSVKEGELDSAEHPLLQRLDQDTQRTQRQTLLVLTQVDQVADPAVLSQVINTIEQQVPQLTTFPVSATRHRQGLEGGKQLLLQRSGLTELRAALDAALGNIPQARAHEKALLFSEINEELLQRHDRLQQQLQDLRQTQHSQRQAFDDGLDGVLKKVCEDLQPTLDMIDHDDALVPDSFDNMFKITAGKQERARLQVAYSLACIEINSHLVRHGVVSLPAQQRSNVRSLDTVMIAVLGVSVKSRKDLRKIFGEQTGRDKLRHGFAHYFELSNDRVALAQQLVMLEADLFQADQARTALHRLGAA